MRSVATPPRSRVRPASSTGQCCTRRCARAGVDCKLGRLPFWRRCCPSPRSAVSSVAATTPATAPRTAHEQGPAAGPPPPRRPRVKQATRANQQACKHACNTTETHSKSAQVSSHATTFCFLRTSHYTEQTRVVCLFSVVCEHAGMHVHTYACLHKKNHTNDVFWRGCLIEPFVMEPTFSAREGHERGARQVR